MVRRLAACTLLLAVAAGCSAGADDDEASPDTEPVTTTTTTTATRTRAPTAQERRWVELAGEWALQFGGELNPIAEDDCRASFREFAGAPPSDRVSAVRELALRVCIAYRQLAHAPEGSSDHKAALAAVRQAEHALNQRVFNLEFEAGPNRPLPVKGGPTEQSRIEPRLTSALTRLLGRRVEARCWSDKDWRVVATHNPYGPGEVGGFVDAVGKIQLAPDVCARLVDVLYRGGARDEPDSDVAAAVVVFAHEAQHAAGIDEEAVAECYAMQAAPRVAELLGFSRTRARELAQIYWEEIYPLAQFPYSSEECRNSGRLDRRPNSDVWP